MQAEEERYRSVLALDPREEASLDRLLETLFDESWRVRRAATEKLAAVPDALKVAARLAEVLRSPGEPGARSAASEALVKLGDGALPAVTGLLRDPHPDPRKFAVEILARWAPGTARPLLVATLSDEDPNVRAAAAEALGPLGDVHTARELEARLEGTPTMLHLALLTALERLEHPMALERLLPFTTLAPLQRAAFRLLGYSAAPGAVELLCRGIRSPLPSVRDAALVGLGRRARRPGLVLDLKPSDLLPGLVRRGLTAESLDARRGALALVTAVKDSTLGMDVARAGEDEALAVEVTAALVALGPDAALSWGAQLGVLPLAARQTAGDALTLLAALAGAKLVPLLQKVLDLGEADLEVFAVRALGRTRAREALAPVMRALMEPTLARVAGRALEVLAEEFPAEALEHLRQMLGLRTSPALLLTLARIGPQTAVAELRKYIRHPDETLRSAAVEAAGELGAVAGGELARLGLADESVQVRVAAARSLSRVWEPSLLRVAVSDESVQVRSAALDAIGGCGAVELLPELERHLEAHEPDLARAALRSLSALSRLSELHLERALGHPTAEVVKDALDLAPAEGWLAALATRGLAHSRPEVRAAAAHALRRSRHPDATAALAAAYATETDPSSKDAMAVHAGPA